jgi:hypothetical protein
MGIARDLERRLERIVDGLSAVVFRGRMQPVDVADRLVRHADLLVEDGPAGPTIPNDYTVGVNPRDLSADGLDRATLETGLAATVAATAAERGWRTGGPIRVHLVDSTSVGQGSIACTASRAPGGLAPWGQLIEERGARHYFFGDNRVLVGRADDTDITLEEAEVSRYHALIFREAGRIWLADLDSANGTTHNGIGLGPEPVAIAPGDLLGFGPATFAFRALS